MATLHAFTEGNITVLIVKLSWKIKAVFIAYDPLNWIKLLLIGLMGGESSSRSSELTAFRKEINLSIRKKKIMALKFKYFFIFCWRKFGVVSMAIIFCEWPFLKSSSSSLWKNKFESIIFLKINSLWFKYLFGLWWSGVSRMIIYVIIHYFLEKIRKTALSTFQSEIGFVALLVKLHFGDVFSGKVTLITQFKNLK